MSRLPNNRFAIAIPTYNRARSLSAVLRDALPVCADLNVKVYVTDNHSRDDTPSLCQSLAKRFPELIYRRNTRELPIERSLMAAITDCPSEYVLWTGDDDYLAGAGLRQFARLLNDAEPSCIVSAASEIPAGVEIDYQRPLSAQIDLRPTGAPHTLRVFRDATAFFADQLYKPPLGTLIVRPARILDTDYQRFYFSLHPHLGALYDALAEEQATGGIHAVVASEPYTMSLTRLESHDKAWREHLEHFARAGFPSWFAALHPIYQPQVPAGLAFHRQIFRRILDEPEDGGLTEPATRTAPSEPGSPRAARRRGG